MIFVCELPDGGVNEIRDRKSASASQARGRTGREGPAGARGAATAAPPGVSVVDDYRAIGPSVDVEVDVAIGTGGRLSVSARTDGIASHSA